MARRSSALRKSEEKLSDEELKRLESTSVKDFDCEKSEDEDEDDAEKLKKPDDDEDEDDDDEDGDTDSAKKSLTPEQKLRKAVTHLATLIKGTDPSLRKEALFAKSLRSNLTEDEAIELHALVTGQPVGQPLRERAAPQLSKSLKKAIGESEAVMDLAKSVAGTHSALCDEMDSFKMSVDAIHCGLAKAMGALCESVASIHQGQGAIAEALDKSLSQPAHEPRSHGVSYLHRPLSGQKAAGLAPAKMEKALSDMRSHAPDEGTRDTLSKALFQLQMTKTVSPQVEHMIKSHLGDA